MVQTEPLRSLQPHHDLAQAIKDADGFFEAREKTLVDDYTLLAEICDPKRVKINLIGGLSTCQSQLIDPYPCLHILESSWPKLLLGDLGQYQDTDWNHFGQWDNWRFDDFSINDLMFQGRLHSIFDTLAEKVINQLLELDRNHRKVFKHEYFSLDNCHPSAEAHRVLFEKIYHQLFVIL